MKSKLHTEGDARPSSDLSTAGSSPTDGQSVAGTVKHQPHELPRDSLSFSSNSDDEGRQVAGSNSYAVEDLPDKQNLRSERGSVEYLAEKGAPASNNGRIEKNSRSERGSVEDLAERSAPASENGRIENIAKQDETETAVGYEDPGTQLPLSCGARSECADHAVLGTVIDVPPNKERPATPSTTPIPPVADRISHPSSSVPYYATPKIMVHKPSQSSESESPAPRTIDEVLANDRQSLPQAEPLQASGFTQDGNQNDAAPMQSMSLTPIAWQAPKTQVLKKRKLYLRKVRNAAARKTILQLTLGRQLAIPTKEMLRLLASGENLTVPDLSNPSVEAATMLVPQGAVGPVTGAVLLPQGVTGAV